MNESSSRAFMYGESVFTTMKMVAGKVHHWDEHFDRLRKGIEFLYGPFAEVENWQALLKGQLEARLQSETGDKVLRLTVFQTQVRGLKQRGLNSVHELLVHLSATPLEHKNSERKAMRLRTCPAIIRPDWWPSFLKAGNYLETIVCQRRFLKPEEDDLIFLSPDNKVLESSVANIFILRHNILYTAPPGPNVLEGVMRRKVLEVSKDVFADSVEAETSLEQLLKADAIFGSNSIRGVFLIDQINEHKISTTANVLAQFGILKNRVLL